MILTDGVAPAKRFDPAVFPGDQGGPPMHVIAEDALAAAGPDGDAAIERAVLADVSALCRRFPIHR